MHALGKLFQILLQLLVQALACSLTRRCNCYHEVPCTNAYELQLSFIGFHLLEHKG